MLISTAYAMGAPGGQAGQAGGFASIVPFMILLAIFYFLLIRPQQQKVKAHQEMVANLKKGNRVITSGGIFGTIVSLDETTLVLEIADKVHITVVRANIADLVSGRDAATRSREKK